jgi:NodT family efflux transporter outer membrane factor (OMF) lipoprotein
MRTWLLVFLAALPPGCKVGPDFQKPGAMVAPAWSGASSNTHSAVMTPARWWSVFNDPVLDGLIETARDSNLSLQIAGRRILEARARLSQSSGNLFPQQQGISGELTYRRLREPTHSVVPHLNQDFTLGQTFFAATWEADIWGKFRRAIESDRAQFLGSIASYDDILVTLIADVAATYVNIRATEERLRVARRNLDTFQESLRLATARFRQGATSERDVRQADTGLRQARAAVPQLQNALNQNRHALAVLLGETPDQADRHVAPEGAIPLAPSSIGIGIPRDLLRRRPDVRMAELQAASQSALIGVAKAAMYPSFSLSGALGISASNQGGESVADTFSWESRAVEAGANFLFPIFNYGRLVSQVRVQDARFQAAVLAYQNTVLVAQQEVEDALSWFATATDRVAELSSAATSARRSTELATVQYREGEVDFTTVLSAEQTQLSIEDDLASSRGAAALGLIAAFRALGGGWEIRREPTFASKTSGAAQAPWERRKGFEPESAAAPGTAGGGFP